MVTAPASTTGVQIRFGVSATVNGGVVVPFSPAFPTACDGVVTTIAGVSDSSNISDGTNLGVGGATAGSFSCFSKPGAGLAFYYFAWGH